MYKEFDVITLTTGVRGTIVEIYNSENFMVEVDFPSGDSETINVHIKDIIAA